MLILEDQTGRSLRIQRKPERIISLVPSLTELLFDLGLGDRIVGRTKFCVHPTHQVDQVKVIGGTKKVHLDKVRQLEPDLIIANKEENLLSDVESLEIDYPVYASKIANFEDLFRFIADLGRIFRISGKADLLIQKIQQSLSELSSLRPRTSLKVLYLIWQKPYMAAGTDTFISHMLEQCGLQNSLSQRGIEGYRYPEVSTEKIKSLDPDLILLSSEPFPFKESHAEKIEAEFGIRTILVDGEFFSWYGTRMLHALEVNKATLEFLRNQQ
jgi:ABC-type Fe3+-hydroxamate transport system substrate-binding protein